MRGKVWIDGAIRPVEKASVGVLDRGFLYGDSVYEVMRVYGNVPFGLREHLRRLYASGARIGFELPWAASFVEAAISEALAAAALGDAYLRVIATRGSGPVNLAPQLAQDPSLVIMVLELPDLPPEVYREGRTAWLVSVRRNLKHAIDPQAKTGNYMNSVLAAGEARARGADEAIMLDGLGRIAEGSSANLFAMLDGVFCTPPLDVGILGGITRQNVLQLCPQLGVPCSQRILWPLDLVEASEVFICSSVREIVPIVRVNDRPVGDGSVGPVTKELVEAYRQRVRRDTSR